MPPEICIIIIIIILTVLFVKPARDVQIGHTRRRERRSNDVFPLAGFMGFLMKSIVIRLVADGLG